MRSQVQPIGPIRPIAGPSRGGGSPLPFDRRATRLALALLAITAISGCMSTGPDLNSLSALEEDQYGAANRYLLADLHDQQIGEAVRIHRTLFPYHFITGSPMMNELGERDLATLSAMYRDVPGDLNMRMGDATPELYEARVDTVLQFLEEAGVRRDDMRIVDGRMGGDGMWSIRAAQAEMEAEDGASTSEAAPTMSESIGK